MATTRTRTQESLKCTRLCKNLGFIWFYVLFGHVFFFVSSATCVSNLCHKAVSHCFIVSRCVPCGLSEGIGLLARASAAWVALSRIPRRN